MADQNNLLGGHKIFRDLLVEGSLLGNTFSLVVRFLAMDQVAMKSVRIIRLDGSFDSWSAATEVLVQPRGMMVDDYVYASELLGLSRSTRADRLQKAIRQFARRNPS